MSIPKEPRQLMINLMYLVLTAMLALNVSAEIINAFFALDKSIDKTNKIVDKATAKVIGDIEETAETKTQYKALVVKAKEATNITKGFYNYINEVRDYMVEQSGGYYTAENNDGNASLIGKPIGKKNKDVPQRIFVSGDYTGAEDTKPKTFEVPVGPDLDKRITALKASYIAFVKSLWDNGGIEETIFADPKKMDGALAKLEADMTLNGSGDYKPEEHEDKSWEEYTFGHMPVAAIYPMLRKYQNDAKTTEAAVVNFLAAQMGKMELNYDKFAVFSQAPKSYVLKGQTYEAFIALGAYSSQAKFSVSVGGRNLNIVDGKAKYTTTANSIGEQSYTATISVTNPLTNKVETFKETFKYEVGAASVSVAADKMNVFYIGVDNPVTVAAAGIPTSAVKSSISGGGGSMSSVSGSKANYIVKVKTPGKANISVTDNRSGKKYNFPFNVKRIPDPIVKLGNKVDGLMGSGEFKAQLGLIPVLENFDFDARCSIQSFTLYYTAKRQDPVEVKGSGARFSGQALAVIKQAKPGSQYAFVDVKARCPGDSAARRVNGLTFKIR